MLHANEEPDLTTMVVEQYEGPKNDKGAFHGDGGVVRFQGGHVYRGSFAEGKMHGTGRYEWADGVVYEGDFECNSITGIGTYTWPP